MTTSTNYQFTADEFSTFATDTERHLHTLLDDPFTLPDGARAYGINKNGNLCFLAKNADVYDLLEAKETQLVRMFDACLILTTGWASPLGANGEVEGRPSEHPQRRRVRLAIVVSDDVEGSPVTVANILCFQDDPENPILDLGSASGSLAEAVVNLYTREGA